MKKICVLFAILALMLYIVGCNYRDKENTASQMSQAPVDSNNIVDTNGVPNRNCKVTFDGETILTENVDVFLNEELGMKYAIFSLVDFLEYIGCEVSWENNYYAKIKCKNKEFYLDLELETLTNSNGRKVEFTMLSGANYCYIQPKQVILNHCGINAITNELGIPCTYDIDCENKTVNISFREVDDSWYEYYEMYREGKIPKDFKESVYGSYEN
ncbi:MAG: hypothetical protein II984_02015 [Clostridia bacterium]|nr:hypothetical protein [Clostridia bacterium]